MHRCVFVLLAACGGRAPTTIRSTPACDPTGHARVVAATTAVELTAALADARPGDLIRVTGTLPGDFVLANAGTKAAPIALCGDAVLVGPSLEHGYTLHITADWWTTGSTAPAWSGCCPSASRSGVVGCVHDSLRERAQAAAADGQAGRARTVAFAGTPAFAARRAHDRGHR